MSNDPSTPGVTSPGPWSWRGPGGWPDANSLTLVDGEGYRIADVYMDSDEDAALIASAPDLRDERNRLAVDLAEAVELLRQAITTYDKRQIADAQALRGRAIVFVDAPWVAPARAFLSRLSTESGS